MICWILKSFQAQNGFNLGNIQEILNLYASGGDHVPRLGYFQSHTHFLSLLWFKRILLKYLTKNKKTNLIQTSTFEKQLTAERRQPDWSPVIFDFLYYISL